MAALIEAGEGRRLSGRDRRGGEQRRRRAAGLQIAQDAGVATAVDPAPAAFPTARASIAPYRPSWRSTASGWWRWRASCASRARGFRRTGRTASSTSTPRCCPPFPGLHVQQQAIDAGVAAQRLHGAFRHRRPRCRADHRPGRGAGAARGHATRRLPRASCARSTASTRWWCAGSPRAASRSSGARSRSPGVPPGATLLFSPDP